VEVYLYSPLYVHDLGRDNFTFRDIGGEVAWIHSAQTADFDFRERGYDPYVPIQCNVFPYHLAGCYVYLKNESVTWS
jgi:hypothetical protein